MRVVRDEETDGGARLRREAELLRVVAEVSPVAVPEPLFVADACMAYRLLGGVALLDVPAAERGRHAVAIGGSLGAALAAIWAVPDERAARVADRDDAPLSEWRDEAETRSDLVPAAARPGIDAFLRAPLPPEPGRLALSHNDLGIEHVLVEPANGRVTGIIDWTDAAITDPAKDLGLILRDLGEEAFAAALKMSGGDVTGARERALFYARCLTLEDLAFGLEHDRSLYVDKSLAALDALFPPAA